MEKDKLSWRTTKFHGERQIRTKKNKITKRKKSFRKIKTPGEKQQRSNNKFAWKKMVL